MEGTEENGLIVINQNDLDKLNTEYVEYSQNAHKDLTYESDYQAALRVPAAFLKRPSNFEQSFDKILFHLDEAYKKCKDEQTRIIVSRTTDDIFHRVICIIQERINYIKTEKQKGFIQKLSEFVSNVISKVGLGNPLVIFSMEVAPELGNLAAAFFDYMISKWEMKQEESYFYNQLANVYQKILDSRSYDSQYGLIRNTFTTNKEDILTYVVSQKGLVAAKNLMKYDEKDSEKQDSARVILRSLTGMGEWEKCANFLREIKDTGLANYTELKDEFITAYEKYLEYLKTWKARNDVDGIRIKKKFPTKEALENLTIDGQSGYNEYMKKRKIIRWSITLFIIFSIIAFLVFAWNKGYEMQQQEQQYQKENATSLNDKWDNVKKTAEAVDTLIESKNYKKAVELANSGIVFMDTSGLAKDYISKANDLRHEKLVKAVDGIFEEITSLNKKDMNDENYQNITDTLLPLYASTISGFEKDLAKSYKEKLEPLMEELDKSRDTYLTQLKNEINDLIDKQEYQKANTLIAKLVHKSDKKRSLLSGKYYKYWDDQRQDLRKKMPANIGE